MFFLKESLLLDINIRGIPQHVGLKLNILSPVCMLTELASVGLSEATRKCTMALCEALYHLRRKKKVKWQQVILPGSPASPTTTGMQRPMAPLDAETALKLSDNFLHYSFPIVLRNV